MITFESVFYIAIIICALIPISTVVITIVCEFLSKIIEYRTGVGNNRFDRIVDYIMDYFLLRLFIVPILIGFVLACIYAIIDGGYLL